MPCTPNLDAAYSLMIANIELMKNETSRTKPKPKIIVSERSRLRINLRASPFRGSGFTFHTRLSELCKADISPVAPTNTPIRLSADFHQTPGR